MDADQTIARTLHDLGAAAWFGGALMGIVSLPAGASTVDGRRAALRVEDVGWQAWKPWRAAAIGAHVVGSLGLLWGNKGRLLAQREAMTVNLVKTGVFVTALAADLTAAALGRRVADARSGVVTSAVAPVPGTDAEARSAQQRLRFVQGAVPVLTGLNVAIAAKMGEQQRPAQQASGLLARLRPDG